MYLTSSLVDKIINTTGLRNIESTHFAGRYNDYFVYVEVQTHLSRALMRVRVSDLDNSTRLDLEKNLEANFSRQNYSILYEGNEILIIIPTNADWVERIRDLMDHITSFLSETGIRADAQAEQIIKEHIPDSVPHIEYEPDKPSLGMGILGSFLGSIPGVITWFITSIASIDGFLVQTPEVYNYFSARFFLAIIITCGSYWGFLLLSGASRKISALISAPITVIMIYIVNRFSYAFLFFNAISNLTVENAFLKTYQYLNSYHLTQYYLGTLVLGYLLSALTYVFLYAAREKFWISHK
ncbi:MAG: hypothetical protein JW780_05110 [Clostridiales bacterium]|nr:hypothetical protein [Clostridiales bacterium]